MGKIVTVTCKRCGGCGRLDDHYDSEKREWVTRICPDCSGAGEVSSYQSDDGSHSSWW